jgi:hypothetical protein
MRTLAVTSLMLVLLVTAAWGQDTIWIDRVEENGRLLVPLRGIFEAYGAQVGWDSGTRTATIAAPALNVSMRIDSNMATLNGQPRTLDTPPRIRNGRTYIPLRFAAESLGERVEYKGDRVELPTIGLTLLIRGEAAGPEMAQGPTGTVTITQPTADARIGPRVEVMGTAPGGSFLVIETEVRAQDDDDLLRVVPGIRHDVPASGNWHFSIAAPTLPENVSEPLYYIIKAYTANDGTSQPATVRVYRAD